MPKFIVVRFRYVPMSGKVTCPVDGCRERLDPRGLHGHLEHGRHDMDHETALEQARKAKRAHKAGKAEPGPAPQAAASAPSAAGEDGDGPGDDPDGDEVDRALSELIRRRTQREKVRTVDELAPGSDPDDGPDAGRSPVDDVTAVAEAAAAFREVFDGGDDGLTESDVRRVVADTMAAEAATDGGAVASDPVTEAVKSGDPEVIDKVAALERSNPWADAFRHAVDRLADADVGEAITSSAVETAVKALAGSRAREDPPEDERRERPDVAPQGPAETEPNRAPRVGDTTDGDRPEPDDREPPARRMRQEREAEESHDDAEVEGGEDHA